MNAASAKQLSVVAEIVERFDLTSLGPTLRACQTLSGDKPPLDVAVLGQFKSGKSSLLNAVLGESIFPVGAVPVTTVITRAAAGPTRSVRVTYEDGSAEEVAPTRLADFVTEAGNPGNRRHVAVVDVFTPAMGHWPGVRLVDTPGLGSVLAHNTAATRDWMPNVAVALVTVSVERPLSDEDRRLVTEARQTAPRVVIMMTKVDLLTDAELAEVTGFLRRVLHESFGDSVPIMPFSSKVHPERYVGQLQEAVLRPVAVDIAGERKAALDLKLAALMRACHSYLSVGLQAADRADADREQLRAAVLSEAVSREVIRDELHLAEQRVQEAARPALEKTLLGQRTPLTKHLREALADELPAWTGNLARQRPRRDCRDRAGRYTTWSCDGVTVKGAWRLLPCRRVAQGANDIRKLANRLAAVYRCIEGDGVPREPPANRADDSYRAEFVGGWLPWALRMSPLFYTGHWNGLPRPSRSSHY
jgi:GTP-binding protein EngB required for normal cell division